MKKDNLAVNAIRMLGVDMINKAKSGHPGIVLGASPIIHTLFSRHLKFNPEDPNWFDRDRFILSAGHGSAMLYAMLHIAGYDLKMKDLKEFRQLNSRTPGHPEYEYVPGKFNLTPGVEATTGPLGQGFAMAVGMAIAENHLAAKFNKEDIKLFDHYTYVLCGDGCLQEGVMQEAASLAGRLHLNKLILLYDSNDIQLDGKVSLANSENVKAKFEAMGFNYLLVKDGNSVNQIDKAIQKAKLSQDKPTIIEIKTIIGFGAPNQGDSSVHGSPILDKTPQLRENLGWKYKEFFVPKSVYRMYQERKELNVALYEESLLQLRNYGLLYPSDYEQALRFWNRDYSVSLDKLPHYDLSKQEATRVICKEVLNKLSEENPFIIGGCADLTKSVNAKGADGNYDFDNPLGRNINYGVREHAMGAIVNGLTLHGLRGFGGGFMIFSDYLKPAIRLSALMHIPSLFIFSHNSILVGEDGPTHEPIEQFAMLRSIPSLNVMNPADPNETVCAFKLALDLKDVPSVITTTRQKVKTLPGTSFENFQKGGYIIKHEENKLDGVIIAAGSEVEMALDVARILEEEGKGVRVVSMPSQYLFDLQSKEYRQEVIPEGIKSMALELSHPMSWYKYSRNVYGIDRFGLSAPANVVKEQLGFSVDKILKYYKKLR